MTVAIGKFIRAMRVKNGMTQGELAERCGLTRTSITNIEAGRQMLSTNTITAIATALGYRVKIKFERVE